MNYWEECISEAFDDAGITATQEQIDKVAGWVESGHDHYGSYTGDEHIPDPVLEENRKLQLELDKEKDKVTCISCSGTGKHVSHGPYHSAYSDCHVCNGAGRHSL